MKKEVMEKNKNLDMSHTLPTTTLLSAALLAAVFFLVGGAPVAMAQSLSVVFEEQPLFKDADVKPGDSTDRTVTVTNNGDEAEDVFVAAQNTSNDGLADVMELLVVDDATQSHFSDTFAEFFATGGAELGSIAAGDSVTYTFTASLPIGTGNEYQKSSFGFDLVVGFVNGDIVTDEPDEQPMLFGMGGGGVGLILSNENATTTAAKSALITWNTNRPATSYVVCGDTSFGPFTLTTEFPLYGYQFVIPESTDLVTEHKMVQTGLEPGTYECRPASRERTTDRFTVGRPLTFTIPEGAVLGERAPEPERPEVTIPPTIPAQPPGSVLGKGWKGAGLTYDEWRAEVDRERAERERIEREALDEPTERPIDPPAETNDTVAPPTTTEPTSLFGGLRNFLNENPGVAWGGGFLLLLALLYATRRYLQARSGM